MSLLSEQPDRKVKKQVGLFVDYENIFPLAPRMGVKEVGKALITHASQFGEVVCRWAVADPRNMRHVPNFRVDFEQVGFRVRSPRDEPREGRVRKNGADLAFIQQVHSEKGTAKPDIYIIVSGDRDYYELIHDLIIEDGATVRLCASLSSHHLAEKYFALEQKRRNQRQADGLECDFFIDDLDLILSSRNGEED
jgi:hypothetical protein